jgi:hypothetical protein
MSNRSNCNRRRDGRRHRQESRGAFRSGWGLGYVGRVDDTPTPLSAIVEALRNAGATEEMIPACP